MLPRILIWLLETLVILIVLGFHMYRIWLYYRAYKENRSTSQDTRFVDISDHGWEMPEKLRPLIVELTELGFSRLGEILIFLPFDRRLTAWVLIDKEQQITVAVFLQFNPDKPAAAEFNTQYDNAYVLTTYNGWQEDVARRINEPDFVAQDVSTSLADACRVHRFNVESMAKRNGSPLLRHTIADLLEQIEIYKQRFHPRRSTGRPPRVARLADWIAFGELGISTAVSVTALFLPSGLGRWLAAILPGTAGLLSIAIVHNIATNLYGKEGMRSSP
jgi:hypothetical protein